MRRPLSSRFVDKAEAAIAAAVEVFNKPAFAYREETFAVLAINAWELLLKAKLLKDDGNHPRAIRVYERRETKAGVLSKKLYLKRNRAGNPMTKGLEACISALDADPTRRLPPAVKANLEALVEIRDNACHYINASPVLARQVVEIGSAAIQNFVGLARKWFRRDMSKSFSLILPLSFLSPAEDASVVSVGQQEHVLIEYLRNLAESTETGSDEFSVAVRLQIKLERSKLDSATKVRVTADPDALPIRLSEQDIREKYPWDYKELVHRLKERYLDFKENEKFHRIRRPLMSNETFVKRRYLDPGNPKSSKKDFFNANTLKEFDSHFTRRDS